MSKVKQLPPRSKVKPSETWDLSSLFASDEAWETAFNAWEGRLGEYATFQGKLAESPESLAGCLQFDLDLDRAAERLGNYAFLKTAEDVGESKYQRMHGRFMAVASRAAQAGSFIRPEILAIPAAKMKSYLDSPALAPYKLLLQRVLRYKPHTLGKKEENLLAMQTEMAQAANQIFRQLNDADLKFGAIKTGRGNLVELSHATFSTLLHAPIGPCGGRPFINTTSSMPITPMRWPLRWPARCRPTSTTPRRETTRSPWRPPCFPTRSRWRSTTT